MFKMEQDPFEPRNHSPEKSWSFFEQDQDEEEKKPEIKKKWFFEKDDEDDHEAKEKPKTESTEDDPKSKKPEVVKKQLTHEDLADMSPEEQKQALAKQYVENRSQQLQEELEAVAPDSAEALEISADIALIENLAEKLENPDLEVDDAVEDAYQQIMDRLDEILGLNLEVEAELEDLASVDKGVEPTTTPPLAPIFAPKKPTNPVAAANGSTSSWGGPSKRPEAPNNTATPPEVQKAEPTNPETPKIIRQRRAGSLAVAEALNQMLSRRYESAPVDAVTEAIPAPSTPERVVNPIKRTIAEKEQRVRTLATAQVVRAPEVTTPEAPADAPSKVPYFEGKPISINPVTPERTYAEQQTSTTRTERPVAAETMRNLQQVSTGELLQIADKIRVDGTSLRDLFTSNQIDREGLTKVVREALKGGDVKSAIKKATLGEEAQRGRKIEMRHDDPAVISDVHTASTQASEARTNQILEALHSVNSVAKAERTSPFTPQSEQEKALAEAAEKIAKKNRLIILSVAATAAVIITGVIFAVLYLI